MPRSPLSLLLFAALSAAACGSGADETQTPKPLYEPPAEGSSASAWEWERTLADGNDAGLQTAMTLDASGNPMLAYLAYVGDYQWDPPTSPFKTSDAAARAPSLPDPPGGGGGGGGGFEPPDDWEDKHPDPIYELRFAKWSGSTWKVEALARVHRARGVSILQASSGQVLVSYMDTDRRNGPEVCMQTHLKIAVKDGGSWRYNKVAQSTAPTWSECPDCGVCETVGEWSSLAEGPGGKIGVAYRKARYTTDIDLNLDSEQRFLESSLSGNTLTPGSPELVKGGESPGFYGELTYADLGAGVAPQIVYMDYDQADEDNQAGLWYATRFNGRWRTSEIRPDYDWLAGPNLQILADDGVLNVMAYVWSGEQTNAKLDLVLLRSGDEGSTWSPEYVHHGGRGGSYPSLAMDGDGRLAVSFYECGVVRDWLCDAESDGLALAVREGPDRWVTELVNNDAFAYDGSWSALEFNGNRPVVAGRVSQHHGPGNSQDLAVFFGTPQ